MTDEQASGEQEYGDALARLDADPVTLAEYRAEVDEWVELDVEAPE